MAGYLFVYTGPTSPTSKIEGGGSFYVNTTGPNVDSGTYYFEFINRGVPKTLKFGDVIAPEDIDYLIRNHPTWVSDGAGGTGATAGGNPIPEGLTAGDFDAGYTLGDWVENISQGTRGYQGTTGPTGPTGAQGA